MSGLWLLYVRALADIHFSNAVYCQVSIWKSFLRYNLILVCHFAVYCNDFSPYLPDIELKRAFSRFFDFEWGPD